jgi:hypothetical protein
MRTYFCNFESDAAPRDNPNKTEFARAVREKRRENLLTEICAFLKENKKWWLVPILVVLLLFGFLIVLSGTSLAPFIYTLF